MYPPNGIEPVFLFAIKETSLSFQQVKDIEKKFEKFFKSKTELFIYGGIHNLAYRWRMVVETQ